MPPNQTKEEEIGNLPEKEFRILIVKMIQNLEIKMESQINRLETRIEKMQERFNKEIEEIKKSQNIMNNAGDAGLIPGSGRSPGEGNGNPLLYSCLGNPIDLVGYCLCLWGHKSQTQLSD